MIRQCPRCGQWKERGEVWHVQERKTTCRIDNHFLCVDCERELEIWFNKGKETTNES